MAAFALAVFALLGLVALRRDLFAPFLMATGYGADTWCTDSLVVGRLARGRTLLAQALYRRLITPRGTLRGGEEERAYGFDVAGYVGAVGYDLAIAALPGLIRGELKKDNRVLDVAASITKQVDLDGSISLEIVINVVPVDESGDFDLTLNVTSVSAELVGGVS
jgi:hypothetical protein